MRRQVVDTFDDDEIMVSGLIVRHLVLPAQVENSKGVLRLIKEIIGTDTIISLMSQYCPVYKALEHKTLNRQITHDEYNQVYDYFLALGFENGYAQDKDSATEEYIPGFK
jgi:putative pyruvate formate lyase activating enzyme